MGVVALKQSVKMAKELRRNDRLYAEKFLKIQTKNMELVSFKYNEIQENLQKRVDELRERGKPVRFIILKARQMGVSTWVQGQLFKRTSTLKHFNSLVAAHVEESSTNLYRMSQRFYDALPNKISFPDRSIMEVKPRTKFSNRKELVFADLDSQLRVATAGSKDIGRSSTLLGLHCSEVAFWDNAEETMKALLQALSDSPHSFAVIESTANGVGGYFHSMWQRAVAGESSWTPIFFGWWELEEYQRPFDSEEAKEEFAKSLDSEERQIKELYNLTLEQLHWRRFTIADKCGGDTDTFRQEYPANPREAFIASGRPYFGRKHLLATESYISEGVRGNLELVPGTYRRLENGQLKVDTGTRVRFVPNPDGYLEVWAYPKRNGTYSVGGDVAEGLEKGDYSVGEVLNRDTGQQVAEWHGHIDPDLFGEELVKLAIYFNRAWLAVEVNNHGISTNKAIVRTGYNRIYRRHAAPDKMEIETTDRVGWRTDQATRPIMLDDLARGIREGSVLISGKGLLEECSTFVINAKGKPAAQEGCHDDRVMAMAIAVQAHQLCPMSRPVSKEEQKRRRIARERELEPVVSSVTGY